MPMVVYSNILTHHAEDGSGVGSAIIAGECIPLNRSDRPEPDLVRSYDQGQEGRGPVPERLKT